MHHRDLAEIREVGCTYMTNTSNSNPWQVGGVGDISFLLAENRPRIEVDESGG